MKNLSKILLKKNNLILLLIFAFLFRILFAFLTWHPDVYNHMDWGLKFFEYTPVKFYHPNTNIWSYTWPNQPPGTMYLFAFIKIIYDILFGLLLFVNDKISFFPSVIVSYSELRLYPALLQLPAILADFGIAYLVYKFTKSKLASLIFIYNPVVWYNSSVWGQYDSVINFLFLLSLFFAYKSKLFLSIFVLAISLYIKISLVIFVPIYLFYILKQYNFKKIIIYALVSFILILIFNLPFSGTNNPIVWLFYVYYKRVWTQQLHLITANAFNFWGFVTGVDWVSNSLKFLNVGYVVWGYILFLIFSLPVFYKSYISKDIKVVLFSLGILYFTAWMFMTNMHERYLYPYFVFGLVGMVMMKKRLYIYFAISLLSLVNMYYLWFTPHIEPFFYISTHLNNRLISLLILALYFKVYINFLRISSSKAI